MTTRAALGVWTLALLVAAGATLLVAGSNHENDKLPTILLAVPTALAFVASGIIARVQRPANATGTLLIAVGFAWAFGALGAANDEYLFTAGLVLGSVFTALLGHLFLAFPTGRLTSRTDRWTVLLFYVVVLALPPLIFLFDEGEIATGCDGPCPENVLSVVGVQPLANVIGIVYAFGSLSLATLVLVRMARRWRRASPALRRSLAPVYATAAILIAVVLFQAIVGLFSEEIAESINWVTLAAILAVPLSILYGLLRSRFGAATRRLVAELSTKRRPIEVQSVLRRELRDPELLLGYRVGDGYVDIDGAPLRLPAESEDRIATKVADEVIVHDAALRDQPELDGVLDAVHLAMERGLSLRSLESSERRATALLEAMPDSMYRVAADGTFLEFRLSETARLPVDVDDLVGMNVRDILTPQAADDVFAAMVRAREQGTVEVVNYTLEFTGDSPRYLEARVVRAGESESVAIVRDITDRTLQELALESLSEGRAALGRVAVAVATATDAESVFGAVTEEVGRLFRANAATLIRFDRLREDEAMIVGLWSDANAALPSVGTQIPLLGGAVTEVRRTGRPARARVPEVARSEPELVERLQEAGITSFVAAPIEVSGEPWGSVVVWLTGAEEFPEDVEERLVQFGKLVAVALANTQAREDLAALAEEQAALSRVAVAVATEDEPERVFDTASEEVGRLFGASSAATVRYLEDEDATVIVGGWDREGVFARKGLRVPFQGGAIARVHDSKRPERVDIENLAPEVQARMEEEGVASQVAAPIVVSGRLWGATSISIGPPDRFPSHAEDRLGKFTSLVAVALANAAAREQLKASRARIVEAGDAERRRLERNLHDGAQQRLVSLALALRLAESRLPDDPQGASELLTRASGELTVGLEELRELARGIHPAILTSRGLAPALDALAERSTVPVDVSGAPSERLPEPIEAAAFYVVSESLTNVAKYASATRARVDVARDDGLLVVEVSDDGVGGADAAKGSGLRGLADRVEALGGRLNVASERGRGTTVRAELPV